MVKKIVSKKATTKNRLVLVIATFNTKLTQHMEKYACKQAAKEGWHVAKIVHVPGCYEIPLAVRHSIGEKGVDVVVVLGWIERGKTLHGEVMGHVVHHALISLEYEFDKPIGIGIIGPGATKLQAWQRAKDTSRGAVSAAIQMKDIIG